jgi:hypothetical protein
MEVHARMQHSDKGDRLITDLIDQPMLSRLD